ncbi:oligosaccharide flippase family protein [Escherichia coli]
MLARILSARGRGIQPGDNVAVVPPMKLNPIITRVLFPAFAKIQDDTEKLRVNFYKLLSVVGIINFPALLGLMVVSITLYRWYLAKVEQHYSRAAIAVCGGATASWVTRLVRC